jgi:sphingomyelin phosphodiesterase acid-like 3
MRIKYSFYIKLVILIFLSSAATGKVNVDAPLARTATFMAIADLHFNPFFTCTRENTCPIVNKLKAKPVSEWKKIFENDDTQKPLYNKEMNYVLFNSALLEFKKQAINHSIQFTLLLGDLLTHHFKENYQKYTGDLTAKGEEDFVNKTIQFIVQQLQEALPFVDIYPVVGNNDSYVDYISEASFYQNNAKIWASLIRNKEIRSNMEREFSKAGYYAFDIPKQSNVHLIILNTTLFARQGKGMEAAAQRELHWLHNELTSVQQHHQKAIIALHIPVGIDVYASIVTHSIISLWHETDTQEFLNEIKHHSDEIIAIFSGHLHADSWQIIELNSRTKIAQIGTPAISPIFGNNPGFKVFFYSRDTLAIKNYLTYYYLLDSCVPQWRLAYNFNTIYSDAYSACTGVVECMDHMPAHSKLANHYKKFYMLGRNAQPITQQNKWFPDYWCAMRNLTPKAYQNCLLANAH